MTYCQCGPDKGATYSLNEQGQSICSRCLLPDMPRTNYLRIGKWMQCASCYNLHTGEHYCGAPWQIPPVGPFPDGVDDAMIQAVKERRMVQS